MTPEKGWYERYSKSYPIDVEEIKKQLEETYGQEVTVEDDDTGVIFRFGKEIINLEK